MVTRREVVGRAAAFATFSTIGSWRTFAADNGSYVVAILGDTHYDAEPESVYHSHYDESNKWAKVQHAEFRRNGEMWRERCPSLVAASAKIAREAKTDFILQIGDLIQGDCDHATTHRKMLEDCITKLRAPYPSDLPFLTVMGNHDFRGKGARAAYLGFAEPFMVQEIVKLTGIAPPVKYPVFSFRMGGDLWVFCDFEMKDMNPICDAIESDPSARYVFLVTHGPVTASPDSSCRWRLGGLKESEATRMRLYETLSRRNAFVLSGHTHTTNFYRHENRFGGFSECIVNSVWSKPELATAVPIHGSPERYGDAKDAKPGRQADWAHESGVFKPWVKEYFYNKGAGHYRLNVSGSSVTMDFYPGASAKPARRFTLA